MMKLNLTKIALTVGLSLGMLSIASVAQAGPGPINGKSLTGQTTEKEAQPELKGAETQKPSLSGEKTEKQLPQQLKGLPANGTSLTGQVSQKPQKR